ncbi:excalibur calcium-binding domain-containing protein [Nocardia sp. NPDC050630]|uniref:excalibur calcium-binding domain-containing protein n=1 Tax=Nocardia sp. NPDC050630 TaxID=3364321 RepID=UPI0037AEF33E
MAISLRKFAIGITLITAVSLGSAACDTGTTPAAKTTPSATLATRIQLTTTTSAAPSAVTSVLPLPPAAPSATPPTTAAVPRSVVPQPVATTAPADVYYPNCDAARAAGAAPLHRGDPGYRSKLDRDNDGIACE